MPQLTDRRTPLALPTEPGAAGAPPPYLMVLVPVLAASLAYTWLLLDRGWVQPAEDGLIWITFVEATIGLGIVALLISYLPTLYTAYSARERIARETA